MTGPKIITIKIIIINIKIIIKNNNLTKTIVTIIMIKINIKIIALTLLFNLKTKVLINHNNKDI